MRKIVAAAVAVGVGAFLITQAPSSQAQEGGVPGALAAISSVLASIQSTLSEIEQAIETLQPANTDILITPPRLAQVDARCAAINPGTSQVNMSVSLRSGSTVLAEGTFNLTPGGIGAFGTAVPAGALDVYCVAQVNSGDVSPVRLTLCTDRSGAVCSAYSDAR